MISRNSVLILVQKVKNTISAVEKMHSLKRVSNCVMVYVGAGSIKVQSIPPKLAIFGILTIDQIQKTVV